MFRRFAFSMIIALFMAAIPCMPSLGMQISGSESESVPFDVELNRESCTHIVYRGHDRYGRNWGDGYVITPDFSFRLIPTAYVDYKDPDGLEIALDLIYENDSDTAMYTETVKVIRGMDIAFDEFYPFFTDFNKDALESRGRLYSDVYSTALRMTIKYYDAEYSVYFLVCDEADYSDYIFRSAD